jgi:hypothetical protein
MGLQQRAVVDVLVLLVVVNEGTFSRNIRHCEDVVVAQWRR